MRWQSGDSAGLLVSRGVLALCLACFTCGLPTAL